VSTSKLFVVSLCLVMFGAMLVPKVRADQWNQATKLTFSGPVEVPGRVLPAGTYWFSLMNDDADRNIVEVWGPERMKLLAIILAIPDYRLEPTGKTVIKFAERPSSQPEALRAWFYPGDNYGHEFVYPEKRATELAKRTSQPVLSMPNELASNITKPAKSAKEPSVMAMKQAHVKAVTPSGKEVEMAQVIQPKPMPETGEKRMPRTASLLPFWGLLGFTSLGAGLLIGGILRRMS
jgi:hypothetical protein